MKNKFLFAALFLFAIKAHSQCTTPLTYMLDSVPPSCPTCCDGSAQIVVSGGCPPYNITWSDGQQGFSAVNLCAGTYSVTVYDGGCCPPLVCVFSVSPSTPTTIHELISNNEQIKISPNPAQHFIKINSSITEGNLKIYNVLGVEVSNQNIYSNKTEINIEHFLSGIYLVVVSKDDKFIFTRFIKN